MNLKHRLPLIAVTLTSVLCIAISIFSLKSGWFIVFQNFFYIPIIIACFYYKKQGFAISVALSCSYFFLIIAFTSDPIIIREAVIRVFLFILIAAVITALSIARAQAETALKKEREKFRTVSEFTYEWEYWTDPQQNILYVSPSCERISGYRPEDFMTESGLIHSVVHPDDRDIFKCHADHYHEAHIDSVGEFDFRIVDRKGEEHWIGHLCQPAYSSDGQFLGRRASNRDITARKKVEKDILEQRNLSQNYLQIAGVMMVALNAAGEVTLINRKGLDILGYQDEQELVGKNWFDVILPKNVVAGVKLVFNQLMSGNLQPVEYYENTVLNRNGEERIVAFHNTVLRDEEGKISGILSSGEDVTESKRAKETLRESEERFRLLIEKTGDIIYTVDARGFLTYLNPTTERILGYTNHELKGQSFAQIIAPECIDAVKDRFKKAMKRESIPVYEADLIRKDRTRLSVEFNVVTVYDSEGKPSGRYGIGRDITERKHAEDALVKSEKRYREMTDFLPISIFEVDSSGDIISFNRTALEVFRYNREDYREGMNALQFFPPEERQRVGENMGKVIQRTSSPGQEFTFIRKDGSTFIGLIYSSPNVHQDETVGIRGAIIDITNHKRMEEEKRSLVERIQRAEKMEALGQLAGGVAHDLNNVLGVLSGYSELLMMEIPEGSRSRGHAEKILQSTHKGAAIIEDLLTLARRGVTVSDVVNLNNVVSDFLKTPVFEKMKDYHPRVTFRTECDKNLLNITGSPLHLEKTLMNLVSNAAESISGKGELTIRTESRYLDKPLRGYDEIKEGDYAVLTVSDTGMGIPAENVEKIFEPFYTKKTMGRSGTGLGLAIVWGTVKDHNGYIDIQTEVGKGTTFTLYFPVTREELTMPQQKAPIERYMGKGESVLVVDDIAEQRDIAAGLITQLGYDVHVVSSGEEAVEYLKGNKADILVLDMIMAPGIDGLETYQRVLEINPKQKAIIVSGFSETERAREAQKLGAGAYVKKPYVMEKIGVAIRDELNR